MAGGNLLVANRRSPKKPDLPATYAKLTRGYAGPSSVARRRVLCRNPGDWSKHFVVLQVPARLRVGSILSLMMVVLVDPRRTEYSVGQVQMCGF